jgi:hypothetical protein
MLVLPTHLASWNGRLIFDYEGAGDETFFRDTPDPACSPFTGRKRYLTN